MMASDFIVDVNELDFEYEVIAFSQNTPVVVDFWAEWCQPCKRLTPLLEALAREANGAFRLARVNVDENPNLAIRFGVRSIPTVKAIVQGQVAGEFTGLQPEPRVREFLASITPPSQTALAVEKAFALLSDHNWRGAETLLAEIETQEPGSPAVALGMLRALVGQGRAVEALPRLNAFPAGRELASAEALRPLIEAESLFSRGALPDETELDAAFRNCVRLAMRGNFEAAMDGLLDVLRADKRYRGGKAHKLMLAVLELYTPGDPLARQYRAELAGVLF